MKIFISGKITNDKKYKRKFKRAEERLKRNGWYVMNPSILPVSGFAFTDYMHICYGMIDVCDAVYFLNDYTDSSGALLEHDYAIAKGMKCLYEGK